MPVDCMVAFPRLTTVESDYQDGQMSRGLDKRLSMELALNHQLVVFNAPGIVGKIDVL